MSSSVDRGNERTLCNVVCVCVSVSVCVFTYVCVCLRVLFCLHASVHERQRGEKVRDRGGKKNIERKKYKTIHFMNCLVLLLQPVSSRSCVFIVMFRSSSSKSVPFCSQVHVCQWLLLSLSSLNVLDQIIFLSCLYIYYFISNSSVFFFIVILFLSVLSLSHI